MCGGLTLEGITSLEQNRGWGAISDEWMSSGSAARGTGGRGNRDGAALISHRSWREGGWINASRAVAGGWYECVVGGSSDQYLSVSRGGIGKCLWCCNWETKPPDWPVLEAVRRFDDRMDVRQSRVGSGTGCHPGPWRALYCVPSSPDSWYLGPATSALRRGKRKMQHTGFPAHAVQLRWTAAAFQGRPRLTGSKSWRQSGLQSATAVLRTVRMVCRGLGWRTLWPIKVPTWDAGQIWREGVEPRLRSTWLWRYPGPVRLAAGWIGAGQLPPG